jgi:hypothetical protein
MEKSGFGIVIILVVLRAIATVGVLVKLGKLRLVFLRAKNALV